MSVALVGLLNAVRFGNPMTLLPPGTIGFETPFLTGLEGLLLGVRRGVLFFSPPVAATVPGLLMLDRRRPAEGLLFAMLIAAYPIGYANLLFSGWRSVLGDALFRTRARLCDLSLGELLMRGLIARTLVVALGVAGLLVQLAGTLVDTSNAPHCRVFTLTRTTRRSRISGAICSKSGLDVGTSVRCAQTRSGDSDMPRCHSR